MKSAGLRAGTYAVRLRGTLWPFIVTLLSALNGYLHCYKQNRRKHDECTRREERIKKSFK